MRAVLTVMALLGAIGMPLTSAVSQTSKDLGNACASTDADKAIAACTTLLSQQHSAQSQAILYLNRGVAWLAKRDLDNAIADLSRSIELDPKKDNAVYNRARAYLQKGEHQRAIEEFTRALELNPGHKFANGDRGFAFQQLGDKDRAMADYGRAMEINPAFLRPYNNRASLNFQLGEYEKAVSDASRYLAADQKWYGAYRIRGEAYFKLGKLDLARRDIEKNLELKPDDARAKSVLAAIDQAEAAKKAQAGKPAPVQQARVERTKPAEAKPVTSAAPLGRRLALVIGNSAYRHTPALANPKNDAADMAAALKRLGFEVMFEQDLDKRAMDDAFRRFAREVRGADAALFYYAGHAMQFEGVNYLMPVDAQLRDEADVAYEMAKLDDVVADMARMNGVRIAVLDSCRNNPLEEKLKRSISLTRGVAPQRGLARIARPEGLLVAYSTQSGNVAEDGRGRNSPFTAALLGHIETPGLEIGPLFRRVMGSVKQATGGKQHPELSILFDGEFYFKPGG